MKKIAKNTVITLVLVLIISLLTVNAFAVMRYTNGATHYTVSADGKITITDYFGKSDTVTIPAKIGNYPVVAIASEAFTGTSVKTLYVPQGVSVPDDAIDDSVTVVYLDSGEKPASGTTDPSNTQQGNTGSGNTQQGNTGSENSVTNNTGTSNTQPDNNEPENTQQGNTVTGNTQQGNTPGSTQQGNSDTGNIKLVQVEIGEGWLEEEESPEENTGDKDTGKSDTSEKTEKPAANDEPYESIPSSTTVIIGSEQLRENNDGSYSDVQGNQFRIDESGKIVDEAGEPVEDAYVIEEAESDVELEDVPVAEEQAVPAEDVTAPVKEENHTGLIIGIAAGVIVVAAIVCAILKKRK